MTILLPSRNLDLANPVNKFYDLNRGLVGYWRVLPAFGSHVVHDLLGRNHGTWNTGGDAISTKWRGTIRPGGFGEWVFDGTDDAISLASSSLFSFEYTDPFSLSIWYRSTATNPSSVESLFSKQLGSGSYTGYSMQIRGNVADDPFRFVLIGSGDGYQREFARPNDTLWHQCVMTWNASNTLNGLQCYVDGSVGINTSNPRDTTISSSVQNSELLSFGCRSVSSQVLNGSIDDIRIYNRALSPNEVKGLYNLTRIRP